MVLETRMNAFLYPPNASKASTKKKPVAETAIKDLEAKRVNHPRTAMGEYTGTPPLSSLAIPSPGPLDYNPKLLKTGIQYSIIGKPSTKIEEKSHIGPGPSKYNTKEIAQTYRQAPQWSFGHRFEFKLVAEDTSSIPFGSEMRHDFGKEARAATISGWFKLYSDDTPSPNRYVPEPEFGPHGTAPQYTFGGKTEFKEEPTPGPLDYDVPQAFRKLKMGASYTMGSKTKGSSFIQEDKEKTPGPDAYMPKVAFTEKSATLKGHHKDLPVLNTPGPTNYIMPSTLFSGPQYSLTGRNIPYQIGNDEDSYIVIQPGPADYDPKVDLTKDKAPAMSLRARTKPLTNPKDSFPGPGAYDPKSGLIKDNNAPKVTIKGRHQRKPETTPGPGDYDNHLSEEKLKRNQAVTMGSKPDTDEERTKVSIEITPGPSDYTIKSLSLIKPAGPAYSLRKHFTGVKLYEYIQTADEVPGPNVYRVSSAGSLNGQSPKISIKSRSSPYVLVFPSNRVDTLRI